MRDKIQNAYRKFVDLDIYLLQVAANERSITHRFANYVEAEFPDYDVDCEYNRDGLIPKRLDSFRTEVRSDDTRGVTVYPDVIVHRRGTHENLVVIEAKTRHNLEVCSGNINCKCDRCKLRAYKSDLGYTFAFFVIFPVGPDLQAPAFLDLTGYIEEIQ